VRWQAQRDTALDLRDFQARWNQSKAPSPLRSAGALQIKTYRDLAAPTQNPTQWHAHSARHWRRLMYG